VVGSQQRIDKARSGRFFLRPTVAQLVREGKEQGEADDIVFLRQNSTQDNGAVDILTDNVVDSIQVFVQLVCKFDRSDTC
jgi:non-canonical (house-cleaning) NTP pyrophosphatase